MGKLTECISSLQLEFRSRLVGEYNNEENYSEYLNSLFPLIESLRDTLRKYTAYSKNDNFIEIYDETFYIIRQMLVFEDNWNASYTMWLQSYKANKINRKDLTSGDVQIYYSYQSFFAHHNQLSNDIRDLDKAIKVYLEFLQSILVKDTWWYRLYSLISFTKRM